MKEKCPLINTDYNKFNDLATECDILEKYIKNNDLDLTRYQINNLKTRLELKRIKRDILYEHINWENEETEEKSNKRKTTLRFTLANILLALLITIFGMWLIIYLGFS